MLIPLAGAARAMTASMSVFLNVQDIEKSLAFYRALGFRVDQEWRDDQGRVAWAELSLDGAELGLGSIGSNDEPGFRSWVSTPLGAGVIVTLTVDDVDRFHRLAQKADAVIEMPPTDRPYGRMMTLNDPDGYTVSFYNVPAKKAAKRPAGKSSRKAAKSTRKAPGKAAKATSKKAGRKAAKTPAKKAKKAARKSSAKRSGR